MSAVRSFVWKALHGRWGPRQAAEPGYSLLLPVPGDLPVFLDLALAVVRQQDPAGRVETLVVPDAATPPVRATVARAAIDWPGPLRLAELRRPDRWLPRLVNRPHHNHWLQLINGAEHARGEYVLLHDADLFIDAPTLHRDQFERCRSGGYACFGVHRVWDDWYEKRARHLAATWEAFFSVDWLRSFPPSLHLGHDNLLDGEAHTFDTTLYPQCLTPSEKIGWHEPAAGLTHFNYVICTYRYFQSARGPFADDRFRVLLVRLLADLFQSADGITSGNAPVSYETATAEGYAEFRGKFDELLRGRFLTDRQKEVARRLLDPFDRRFCWGGAPGAPTQVLTRSGGQD